MMWIIISLAVFCTVLGAAGALFLKKGGDNFSFNLLILVKNYYIIIGLAFYVIASILFVYALKFGELSMIYPLTSLSYVWVTILSKRVLNEPVTRAKWIGISLIIFGVVLITLK